MAETILAGDATYPGVDQVIDCQYTCGWSVAAARVSLEIIPQDVSRIQGSGDLVLTDGNSSFPIKDCQVVDLQAPQGDAGPLLLILEDGRARWDFSEISARYNVPFDRSQTVSPLADPLNAAGNHLVAPEPAPHGEEVIRRMLPAPDLAKLLLAAMKVKDYDISGLDAKATPHVEWDCVNPAAALAQLAADLGCVVAFNPSTLKVTVAKQGVGDGLPGGELRVAPQIHARPRPDYLRLRGAFDRIQLRVCLMAVGLDFDGSYRPLSQLSYRPIAPKDWTTVPPAVFPGLPTADFLPGKYRQEDAVALATASVYKCYMPVYYADPNQDTQTLNDPNLARHENPALKAVLKELADTGFPKPPKVYGVRYRKNKKDKPPEDIYDIRLLPFKNETTVDDTGRSARVPAKCYGVHTPPPMCRLGDSVLTRAAQTTKTTEVRVPFRILNLGNDDQVIYFDRCVCIYDQVLQKVFPAEIVIECACEIALSSGQWYRTGWDLRLPGAGLTAGDTTRSTAPLPAVNNKPPMVGVIVRDDVIFRRVATYEPSSNDYRNMKDNESVVQKRADFYLKGEARRYELVLSGDATYPGIRPLFPTGTWMQVTWSLSPPTTRVSMNTEHALYLPSFESRRQDEQNTLEQQRRDKAAAVAVAEQAAIAVAVALR